MIDDRELVRRMLRRDEAAFTEFFDAYFPPLFRFAMARLGGDHAGSEDVVQATLCRAVNKLATWRGEAALFTWLCTFCRHEISAFVERTRRTWREVELLEDRPDVRAALESIAGTTIDAPDRAYERDELSRLVRVVLDHLPRHYGDVLEWKYVEGLSVKDIAGRMNASAKAVESLLVRARQAFREGFSALQGDVTPFNPSSTQSEPAS